MFFSRRSDLSFVRLYIFYSSIFWCSEIVIYTSKHSLYFAAGITT